MNYPDYDSESPVTPLKPEEVAALDGLLQRLPADTAMSLDGFDGYLTAIAIGPAALREMPTADWLPLIWGGDSVGVDEAAPFATKRQRKNTVVADRLFKRPFSFPMAPRTRQNTAPGALESVFEGGCGLLGIRQRRRKSSFLGASCGLSLVARPLPSVPRIHGRSRIQRSGVPGRMNRRGWATSGRLQRLATGRRPRRRPRLLFPGA